MTLFSYPLVNGIFSAMLLFHVLSAVLPKIPAFILNVVNILVHAAFVLPLAYYGFKTEEGALLYMISLFVYVFIGFVKYRITKAKSVSEEPEEEEEV